MRRYSLSFVSMFSAARRDKLCKQLINGKLDKYTKIMRQLVTVQIFNVYYLLRLGIFLFSRFCLALLY